MANLGDTRSPRCKKAIETTASVPSKAKKIAVVRSSMTLIGAKKRR